MNVEGLKAMVEIGERFVARLRRGRSWDACMVTRTMTATLTASRKLESDACHLVSMYDHVIITNSQDLRVASYSRIFYAHMLNLKGKLEVNTTVSSSRFGACGTVTCLRGCNLIPQEIP